MILFIGLAVIVWAWLSELFDSTVTYLALWYHDRRTRFRWDFKPLTFLIAAAEVGGFAWLVYFYATHGIAPTVQVSSLVAIIGGWFAIKTVTYRLDPAEEQKVGLTQTEMKHRYILITLFNIGGGLVVGGVLCAVR